MARGTPSKAYVAVEGTTSGSSSVLRTARLGSEGLGGEHVLALCVLDRRGPHHPEEQRPGDDGDDHDDVHDAVAEEGHDHEGKHQVGEGQEDVRDDGQHLVDPASEVAGDDAEHAAEAARPMAMDAEPTSSETRDPNTRRDRMSRPFVLHPSRWDEYGCPRLWSSSPAPPG